MKKYSLLLLGLSTFASANTPVATPDFKSIFPNKKIEIKSEKLENSPDGYQYNWKVLVEGCQTFSVTAPASCSELDSGLSCELGDLTKLTSTEESNTCSSENKINQLKAIASLEVTDATIRYFENAESFAASTTLPLEFLAEECGIKRGIEVSTELARTFGKYVSFEDLAKVLEVAIQPAEEYKLCATNRINLNRPAGPGVDFLNRTLSVEKESEAAVLSLYAEFN